MKRLSDIVISLIALFLLSPLLVILAVAIALDSKGGILFLQNRIGLNEVPFSILKFRTMKPKSEGEGQLTVGSSDNRITQVGKFLRRYKLDELPQLFNILLGEMSLVGPRPEVPQFVELYSKEQKKVLSVRPGLTDYASLEYFDENDLLAQSSDPRATYVNEIMPAKLELNLKYIEDSSFSTDMSILAKTIVRIFS
jgi:lipopolysaccharide/colanic/teichoic acid biosynthesis glycosyltransferase